MYGSDVIDAYLMAKKAEDTAPTTIATYRKILHRWGRYLLAHNSHVLQAGYHDVIRYQCSCLDDQLASRTQHTYTTVLKGFCAWLADNEYVPKNPASKIKTPRIALDAAEPPQMEDYRQLLAAIPTDDYLGFRDRAILLAFFATGLRITELCSLRVGQIDFEKRQFPIVGKGSKRRMVFIHEFAARVVQEYIECWRSRLRGAGLTSSLWLSSHGCPMTPNKVRDMMSRRRKLAGIDSVNIYPSGHVKSRLTPHHLRALFATELWRAGASLPVVQQLLGHESLETTRVYLGVSDGDLHAAIPLLPLESIAA